MYRFLSICVQNMQKMLKTQTIFGSPKLVWDIKKRRILCWFQICRNGLKNVPEKRLLLHYIPIFAYNFFSKKRNLPDDKVWTGNPGTPYPVQLKLRVLSNSAEEKHNSHGWRKKGIILYMDGGGPTYAARSLPQYISAFATRVLQCTSMCMKGERAWARFLNFLIPGINSAIFSQKNHHTKHNCFISLTPTIVDSILDTFSIPGIDFPPLLHTYKNFASGELHLLNESGTSHFHWLLGV